MATPIAYLDTCIVSGVVKRDIGNENMSALQRILAAMDRGVLDIVTSSVTKTEIDRIPDAYRTPHDNVLELLRRVPTAPKHIGSTRIIGGPNATAGITTAGWREDPLFAQLRSLLPDAEDAEHTFQASRNGARYLITVDQKTLLKHSPRVMLLSGVKLVTPVEFEIAELNPCRALPEGTQS
jgi:hypothetical protein